MIPPTGIKGNTISSETTSQQQHRHHTDRTPLQHDIAGDSPDETNGTSILYTRTDDRNTDSFTRGITPSKPNLRLPMITYHAPPPLTLTTLTADTTMSRDLTPRQTTTFEWTKTKNPMRCRKPWNYCEMGVLVSFLSPNNTAGCD